MSQQTVATCKRVFGPTHATTTSTMHTFAIMPPDVAGKPAEAEKVFRDVVHLATPVGHGGELSSAALTARRCIQVALRNQQKFGKAAAECRSFLALCGQGNIDTAPGCVDDTKMALGALLCDQLGKPDEAELLFRVALDHRQNEYGLDHPGVHEVFHNLCVSLENQADDHKLLTFLDGYLETYTNHLERRQLTRARTCCTSRSRGQPCCWYALRRTLMLKKR